MKTTLTFGPAASPTTACGSAADHAADNALVLLRRTAGLFRVAVKRLLVRRSRCSDLAQLANMSRHQLADIGLVEWPCAQIERLRRDNPMVW